MIQASRGIIVTPSNHYRISACFCSIGCGLTRVGFYWLAFGGRPDHANPVWPAQAVRRDLLCPVRMLCQLFCRILMPCQRSMLYARRPKKYWVDQLSYCIVLYIGLLFLMPDPFLYFGIYVTMGRQLVMWPQVALTDLDIKITLPSIKLFDGQWRSERDLFHFWYLD